MSRILVVEDEQHLAEGIRFNLELDGYEVEMIGDGLRALERLAPEPSEPQPGPPIDLVLLDVMLPGARRLRDRERMRQAGNFAPVLMLTAKGLPEDVVHGLEAGADDYLPKPFDLAVLLARVKGLIRRRDWARGPGEGPEAARVGARRGGLPQLPAAARRRDRAAHPARDDAAEAARAAPGPRGLEGRDPREGVEPRARTPRRAPWTTSSCGCAATSRTDPRTPQLLLTVRGVGYRLVEESLSPR